MEELPYQDLLNKLKAEYDKISYREDCSLSDNSRKRRLYAQMKYWERRQEKES